MSGKFELVQTGGMLEEDAVASLVQKHDRLYWEECSPEISDSEYDALVERLRELAPDHPLLHKIHGERGKVQHEVPILSLDKVYSAEELHAWMTGVARSSDERFGVSTKWDGASAHYRTDGKLISRGDGEYGEDWTNKLPFLTAITDVDEGRGEIVVLKSDFDKYRDLVRDILGKEYKNQRSMAAGLLNNAELPPELPPFLTFIPFTYQEEEITFSDFPDLDWAASMEAAQAGDTPSDGLVIRLLDQAYADSLGATEHHPRGAIAYKFKNPSAETVLIAVEWQAGKERVSPIAILEPVQISGVTISRVTLHNLDVLAEKDLHIGDRIEIQRAGDVIPHISRVVSPGKVRTRIVCGKCPACDGAVEIVDQNYRCVDPDCIGSKGRKLLDAIKRLGIEEIGPGTVKKLIAVGVEHVGNVLSAPIEVWKHLSGFGDTSSMNVYSEVQRVIRSPIEDFKVLACLNLPGIGLTLSKKVLDCVSFSELRQMNAALISGLPGIGPMRAQEIWQGLRDNEAVILHLLQTFTEVVETKGLSSRPLVVFTGRDALSRDEWVRLAKAHGMEPAPRVTKGVAYLVCGSTESESTKMKAARKYETRIVTYLEFRQLLQGGST